MSNTTLPASYFGIVLGLAGLGQAWRLAHPLWGFPVIIGESILAVATLVWLTLLIVYIAKAIRNPALISQEFRHPVQGGTPALIGVSTLLIVLAVLPYSRPIALILSTAGIVWHLFFSLWHNGSLWKGGRNKVDSVPTLYLPTVAGNFTSAAALGALGYPDWGWLFLGAGMFSWLALESLIIQRLWQAQELPSQQRPLLGIQFAPPVVCAMAWLSINPGSNDHWVLMLWGYGLYQLMLGIRLGKWLGAQPFAPSYWAYTFGIAAATVSGLKLALTGVYAAELIAIPVFIGANLFIGYLSIRTLGMFMKKRK
ncbi:dicarboxylate transporter/tellurite-resistance protein TehA [Vibrio sp. VB16]|uniref:dicarboxylate transporter/tellurite-resistance protein TehA n=1 Tax=Vibrio sp. VB16 TaxID=2785746 RepID=UPI00189E2A25|nr:dicarboxylate transporter/tellurite-resistance protein TehA [Vibrio sp. VB16]UGA53381.1 dicarboxylate transporter/tellurite-resistance protein TehA [Vibrio sp. VB16]